MGWKTQRTMQSVSVDADVDVSVDEFTEEQLLQGLINAGWLSDDEAGKIKERADKKEKTKEVALGLPGEAFDADELQAAFDYIRRGAKAEALLHLGRALGRDWYGVLN